jgi:hypothetical protein
LQAIGYGGPSKKPKMKTYVDDHGRSFERCEVENQWELERDENGNVIPLLDERGNLVADVDVSDEFWRNKPGCNVPPRGVLKTKAAPGSRFRGRPGTPDTTKFASRFIRAREAPPPHGGSKK